jgi:hypothetical protein
MTRLRLRFYLLAALSLALPFNGRAQFDWIINADNTITIIRNTEYVINLTIPDTIDGLPVTGIADYAFSLSPVVGEITIPASVTNIGLQTFGGACAATGIAVDTNNPVYSSLAGALFNKDQTVLIHRLQSQTGAYVIPDTVTNVADYAFAGCSGLTNITIPDGVSCLGNSALYGCSGLTNITFPASIITLGTNVFANCTHLIGITVNPLNSAYSSVDGVLFNKDQTTLVLLPGAKSANYTIPETVTKIGEEAFAGCLTLTNVAIPAGVASIENNAFFGCSPLTSLNLPDAVTNIGAAAFWGCSGLTNINIPDGVIHIGDSAFWGCAGLTRLTIPDGITVIEDGTFSGCFNLSYINIPASVTRIGSSAFSFCFALTNVVIPDGITSIEDNTFESCDFTDIVIPAGVTNIGDYAFYLCHALDQIHFEGNAPTSVGISAFNYYNYAPQPTAYYLPGTTGWDDFASQTGVQTVLWLPQMQLAGTGSGGPPNQFGFNISWAYGKTVVVEAATDLANPDWQPLQTNLLTTGSAWFSDPQWTNYPGRFYRLHTP